MQILITGEFLFNFHCYRYRILSMPPVRGNLLKTLCHFWICSMAYSYQFNPQRWLLLNFLCLPVWFSRYRFLYICHLHSTTLLKGGEVCGVRGSGTIVWFKLNLMHHSNINQLRIWLCIFKRKTWTVMRHSFLLQQKEAGEPNSDCMKPQVIGDNCHWSLDLCWYSLLLNGLHICMFRLAQNS